jgi:PEP-CTERM motif
MKKLILSFALVTLLAASTQAGVILGTSNPSGTPLIMSAGSTSGSMFVNVISDNPGQDIMSAWGIGLAIMPEGSASGMLTFQDPATSMLVNPPANYIFGSDGFGISATNGGTTLTANDFYVGTGPGSVVPNASPANLLQMDFLASSNASGLFGIYAYEYSTLPPPQGKAFTQWTDGNANTVLYENVPGGLGTVLIGEVLISQSVPEPSTLVMLGLSTAAIAGSRWLWKRKQTA